MSLSRLRIVAINDVYELRNLCKLQTFLSKLDPSPTAVLLAGDFLSPSTLSSMDGGRGMVDSLRATGITHVCFGNHEADVKLATLKQRVDELSKSATVINTNMRCPPKEALWLTSSLTPPYAMVSTPCNKVNVALLGFMSDEANMFRNGTFKGVPIDNVLTTFSAMYEKLVPDVAQMVVPMTHQSLARDVELAELMLDVGITKGIIVGGHEHDPIDETVRKNGSPDERSINIIKTGFDARQASLIDIDFDVSVVPPVLVRLSSSFQNISNYEESFVVKEIVQTHLSIIEKMENEIIIDDSMIPPGTLLSSERSRYSQTTMGGFICHAIKEELEADVAMINGASVAGATTYHDNALSYSQLKRELPFPTKMVVVPMTRAELQDTIDYSRTYLVDAETTGCSAMRHGKSDEVPRRGYLQVDFEYDEDPYSGAQDDDLLVALPRNLLGGFCSIEPLLEHSKRLKENNQLPGKDDFVPALDLVTRYCCKNRWVSMLRGRVFEDFDLNKDGSLDKNEVKAMMTKVLGYEPQNFVVEDMIKSIDTDENGVIDVGELAHVIASMERT